MRNGFSLMELIIVIVIVGILIGAVLGMMGSKETAKYVTSSNQISKIKETADNYLRANGLIRYSVLGTNAKSTIDTFLGKPLQLNPWSRPYTLIGDNTGLHVGTKLGSIKACEVMVKQLSSRATASCSGTVLTVDFVD